MRITGQLLSQETVEYTDDRTKQRAFYYRVRVLDLTPGAEDVVVARVDDAFPMTNMPKPGESVDFATSATVFKDRRSGEPRLSMRVLRPWVASAVPQLASTGSKP